MAMSEAETAKLETLLSGMGSPGAGAAAPLERLKYGNNATLADGKSIGKRRLQLALALFGPEMTHALVNRDKSKGVIHNTREAWKAGAPVREASRHRGGHSVSREDLLRRFTELDAAPRHKKDELLKGIIADMQEAPDHKAPTPPKTGTPPRTPSTKSRESTDLEAMLALEMEQSDGKTKPATPMSEGEVKKLQERARSFMTKYKQARGGLHTIHEQKSWSDWYAEIKNQRKIEKERREEDASIRARQQKAQLTTEEAQTKIDTENTRLTTKQMGEEGAFRHAVLSLLRSSQDRMASLVDAIRGGKGAGGAVHSPSTEADDGGGGPDFNFDFERRKPPVGEGAGSAGRKPPGGKPGGRFGRIGRLAGRIPGASAIGEGVGAAGRLGARVAGGVGRLGPQLAALAGVINIGTSLYNAGDDLGKPTTALDRHDVNAAVEAGILNTGLGATLGVVDLVANHLLFPALGYNDESDRIDSEGAVRARLAHAMGGTNLTQGLSNVFHQNPALSSILAYVNPLTGAYNTSSMLFNWMFGKGNTPSPAEKGMDNLGSKMESAAKVLEADTRQMRKDRLESQDLLDTMNNEGGGEDKPSWFGRTVQGVSNVANAYYTMASNAINGRPISQGVAAAYSGGQPSGGGGGAGSALPSSAMPLSGDLADKPLGFVSAGEESGGEGTASISWDKNGGWSYGTYQFAANTGAIGDFIKRLKKQGHADYASALEAAGGEAGAKAGSDAFKAAWRKLAADPGFKKAEQEDHIHAYFDVAAANILKMTGLDVNRSRALQELTISTAAQHGPNPAGAPHIFQKALATIGGPSASDADIIKAVMNERATGGYFKNSTAQERHNIETIRFPRETQTLLGVAANEAANKPAGGAAATKDFAMDMLDNKAERADFLVGGPADTPYGAATARPEPALTQQLASAVQTEQAGGTPSGGQMSAAEQAGAQAGTAPQAMGVNQTPSQQMTATPLAGPNTTQTPLLVPEAGMAQSMSSYVQNAVASAMSDATPNVPQGMINKRPNTPVPDAQGTVVSSVPPAPAPDVAMHVDSFGTMVLVGVPGS